MVKQKLVSTAIVAVISMGVNMAVQAQALNVDKLDKCYGIAKTAKNDCATKNHTCASLAKTDNDPNEWVFTMKGTCIKLGGQLTPGKSS